MTQGFSRATDWFGQPRGLTVLFLTEMWEKFSFFGMRALLVFYMTKQLAFTGAKASLIYGLYAAFVYFTPIIGGAISDRWLSRRTGVILGGSIMALGHFLMAFPPLLFVALATIAVGNGLYLPNLPSQIDQLYEREDPRRGSAYNVYYVGINLGAFLAPLVCGTLGELYGWHLGFGAAGVGMCLGLATYILGGRWLPADTGRSPQAAASGKTRPKSDNGLRLRVLGGVLLSVVVFRGAYEQIGNSVALWADADVNRSFGSFVAPASWFQSLNPLLIFLLTPVLVTLWTVAAQRGRASSALQKMALGAVGLALSYLFLAGVSYLCRTAGVKPPAMALATFITGLSLAELFILPIGLGLFSRLAAEGYRATMIAAWFLAAFFGNLLAGYLGSFWSSVSHESFFAGMAGVALIAAAGLRVLDGPAQTVEADHLAQERAET